MRKKLISLLLVLCMVLTFAPAAFAAEGDEDTGDDGRYFTDQYHDQDIDLKTLEITPITQEDVDALVAALTAALEDASATDEDVEAAFKAVANAYTTAFTNYELLNFLSSMDVTDEELADAMLDYYDLGVSAADQLCLAVKAVLGSDHKDYFVEAEKLTDSDIEYYLAYEAMTDEEKALVAEMQAITPEYNAAYNSGFPVTYEGAEYTFESLEEAYAAGTVDDDTYAAVSDLLYTALYEGLGGIYLKMLDVGRRIAGFYGYDNYAEYGYPNSYGRDFTPEEIQEYCDAVKEYIAPLAAELDSVYAGDAYSASEDAYNLYAYTDYTTDATLDTVETYINKLSPEMGEAFRYMREHNLYDIAYGETKDTGAYTYILESYGAPYLFSSPNEWMVDFSTLVHEFGHFNNFYWHPTGWNAASANTDLAEVHSQGLELLFTQFYDDIFGEEAGQLGEDMVMSSILTSAIIDGALLGELEIYAHSTPDVTFDDLCAKYQELCAEYGLDDSDPYWWVIVPHLTVQPLYYISYSVSAAGACIFWLDAQEKGWDVALDEYLTFVAQDPSIGFQDQFTDMGLSNPLSPEFIEELSENLYTALDLDARAQEYIFRDVNSSNENFDYIIYLALQGGVGGDEKGCFNPDDTATRAQVVQVLYNLFAEGGEEEPTPLTDISGKWYNDAAAWAYNNNILTGYNDAATGALVFDGNGEVDEQTMAVLFCRVLQCFGVFDCVPTETHEYTDTVATWAKDSVDFLVELGILAPDETGAIGAADPVSRGDMAHYIYTLIAD